MFYLLQDLNKNNNTKEISLTALANRFKRRSWTTPILRRLFRSAPQQEEKAEETLRSALTADEFDVISASGGVDLRFKVVDVFQSSFKAVKTALAK